MSAIAASPAERKPRGRGLARRRGVSIVMVTLTCIAAALAVVPLLVILAYLLRQGAGALSLGFFTNMPRPVGEVGGGMANAIIGTLMLIGIASVVGLPVGIGAGLYLAERGLRFYAGVPLRFHDHAIGSLCILDVKPRRLTEREQRLLEIMADDVVEEIKRRSEKSSVAAAA